MKPIYSLNVIKNAHHELWLGCIKATKKPPYLRIWGVIRDPVNKITRSFYHLIEFTSIKYLKD